MSNWSKIILCWSGIDDKAKSLGERLNEINVELKKRDDALNRDNPWDWKPIRWDAIPEHGMACECVALGEANNWSPAGLLCVLSQLEWEYPDEVELFWKDEEHGSFQRCTPRF